MPLLPITGVPAESAAPPSAKKLHLTAPVAPSSATSAPTYTVPSASTAGPESPQMVPPPRKYRHCVNGATAGPSEPPAPVACDVPPATGHGAAALSCIADALGDGDTLAVVDCDARERDADVDADALRDRLPEPLVVRVGDARDLDCDADAVAAAEREPVADTVTVLLGVGEGALPMQYT